MLFCADAHSLRRIRDLVRVINKLIGCASLPGSSWGGEIFAIGRVPGWADQVMEQMESNILMLEQWQA